jgi:uncharacterized protein (TIGR02246 family)
MDDLNLRFLYRSLLDAWNRRDAAAMAALYSERGGQVGFDGSMANGRAEIEAHLRPVFADHPTARFVGKVREIRMLGDHCALIRAVAGMVKPGHDDIAPDRNTIQTLVACRDRDGRWRVEMFHNTPAAFDGRPDDVEALTEELRGEMHHSWPDGAPGPRPSP